MTHTEPTALNLWWLQLHLGHRRFLPSLASTSPSLLEREPLRGREKCRALGGAGAEQTGTPGQLCDSLAGLLACPLGSIRRLFFRDCLHLVAFTALS